MNLLMRLQSPLRDRRGRISPLKASTFAFIAIVPTFAILWPWMTDSAGGDPSIMLTYTTGTWSCWLFILSLTVTPARRIFGLTQVVALRRMLGVGAVAYALAHCVVFFWLIHYDWATFVKETQRPTIWVATAATVGFLVLAATSLDSAVAKMGLWWNRVHNLTYVLTGAALLHFLLSRASTAGLPFLLAGVFFWLMAWRVLDRFRSGTSVRSLLGLGVAVVVFTIGFEAVWLYFYRGRQLLRTLTGEVTLNADFFNPVPASLQLLIVTLAVPLLMATLRRPGLARRFRLSPLRVGEKPLGAGVASG
jgi:sulfoxide reductase heme-binding subunit YedZ